MDEELDIDDDDIEANIEAEEELRHYEEEQSLANTRREKEAEEEEAKRQANPRLYTLESPGLLQSQVTGMRELSELVDAELISQDGQLFRCHRLVLALGSGFFRTKFGGSWNDVTAGSLPHVEIPYPGHVIEHVLNWLYANRVEIESGELLGLVYAADHLQIPSLCENCLQLLGAQLSCDNATDVWEVSQAGLPPGIDSALVHRLEHEILSHCLAHFNQLTSCARYLRGLDAKLLGRLIENDGLSASEEQVFRALMRWRGERRAAGRWNSADDAEFQALLRSVRFPFLSTDFLGRDVYMASQDASLSAGALSTMKSLTIEGYMANTGTLRSDPTQPRHRPRHAWGGAHRAFLVN